MAAAVAPRFEDLHGALGRRKTPLLTTGSDDEPYQSRRMRGSEKLMSQAFSLCLHTIGICRRDYENDVSRLVRCDSSGLEGFLKLSCTILLQKPLNCSGLTCRSRNSAWSVLLIISHHRKRISGAVRSCHSALPPLHTMIVALMPLRTIP